MTESGPEFAHATRDAPCVVIERGIVRQGDGMIRRGMAEAFEVELLAADDGGNDIANEIRLRRGQTTKRFEQRRRFSKQQPLGGIGDSLIDGFRPWGWWSTAEVIGKTMQAFQTQRRGSRGGVSERVAGAREHVAERRGPSHRPRQQAQRKVKRARNTFEQLVGAGGLQCGEAITSPRAGQGRGCRMFPERDLALVRQPRQIPPAWTGRGMISATAMP